MNKKIILGIVSVVVLSIAYYGISPLFRNTRVDEAAPIAQEPLPNAPLDSTVQISDIEQEEKVPSDPSDAMENSKDSSFTHKPIGEESVPKAVSSPIIGTTGHPASGSVRVINTEGGAVIRYENFKTINGPDLFVYLAKDLDAKEFVNLGELKATEGNVNYSVPQGVDVNEYPYVMVWCKAFGVLFNHADLSLIQ